MIKKFLFIAIGFLSTQILFSQQYQFENISTTDGLSQNSVVAIAEDSLGFIWFATQDGLNRFDGTYFMNYEIFFKDITKSDYSQLGRLLVDKQKKIWMTTLSGGLQYYNQQTDKFKVIKGVKDVSSIIQIDANSYYVTSFTNGLFLLKFDGSEFLPENLIENKYIKQIHIADELILLTDDGLIKYNPESNIETHLFKGMGHIGDLIVNNKNEYLFSAHSNKIYQTNALAKPTLFLDLPGKSKIQDLFIDSSKKLWIATRGEGLFLFDNDKLSNFKTNPINPNSISYNDVLCVFEDSRKNIWFGTDGRGVNLLLGNQKPIKLLTNNLTPQNIPVDVPRAISTDKEGNFWIGTSGKGLSKVSSDFTKFENFNTQNFSNVGFKNDRIMSLYHDDLDNLWIGCQDGGLLLKRKNEATFNQIELKANTIWIIKEADDKNLWIGTRSSGLLLLNKSTFSYQSIQNNTGYKDLDKESIRAITKTNIKGQFFIGTERGRVFEIENFQVSKEISINAYDLGSIKSLHYSDSKLWIGSQKSGLIIKDLSNEKEWHINKSKGLPNNVIYSILPQNGKELWISTNNGICQIDKEKLLTDESGYIKQHLTTSNGLVSNEFNTGAFHLDSTGTMYFGGIDGINWFNPDEITKDTNPINIVLLDLITSDKNGSKVINLINKAEIELKYPVRNFQLKYIAQSFSSKSKPKYKYMFEGINEDWVDNGNNELVSFSNISPGDYTFKILCTNKDGEWSNNSTNLSIKILPTFWQTNWFKLLSIISSVTLLWFFYHIRVRELKRSSELKEQLSLIEAKALKLQMNPHFIFNSLNAIDNYILKNEKIIASEYLSKFSKLMRQILDFSEQSQISLTQELDILELYIKMEQLRYHDRFEYTLNIQSDINTDELKVPPLVLQPFVENAIWHGLMHIENGGLLKIDILKSDSGIKCLIDDNGIGREKAAIINSKSATKSKSYGMNITEKRLSLINDLNKNNASVLVHDKKNADGSAAGTTIEINFPNN